ncbi:MAG: SpoIIE family protein phosphatase [Candidatus Eremiobacteraeota bacterium]|nr:SpoIIE family protein phosphatase [Candidatus Eremiobacteraeota bacterium]
MVSFPRISRRTAITLALVVGLFIAFTYATFLSYWGSQRLFDAYGYQTAVTDAQRDLAVLEVQQFDGGATPEELVPYVALLQRDFNQINGIAETQTQRAPHIHLPATRSEYETINEKLISLQNDGSEAFAKTVRRNRATRDLSNAMFALVALLFAVLAGGLRRAVEEGQSLVERLQRAFISARRPIPNVDLGSVLLSATRGSNVGGDTHDAFTFDRRHGLFLVADVSGKGIDAAVDTALIKFTMRTLFFENDDPGVMLTKFAKIYAQTAEKPETFVVLFVAVVDLADGTLRYASAGHEPAWVVRGRLVEQLPTTGPIVGISEEEYGTRSLALGVGDALVISTDGLTESRDSRGRLLGADTVRDWLAQLSGPAQKVADAVVRRLRKRSSRITDDLAILVVRYAPSSEPSVLDETRSVLSRSDAGAPVP